MDPANDDTSSGIVSSAYGKPSVMNMNSLVACFISQPFLERSLCYSPSEMGYSFHGPAANDSRDLTAITRIVNDATGYRASDTRQVVKQLRKLGALVDLRVTDEKVPCRSGGGFQVLCQYHIR